MKKVVYSFRYRPGPGQVGREVFHIVLIEEVRSIKNGNLSKWDKSLDEALKTWGDGEILKTIWEGSASEEMETRLMRLSNIATVQDT